MPTWVAHLIQAGMRSTHSPYAVSTRDFTFVLQNVEQNLGNPCQRDSLTAAMSTRTAKAWEGKEPFRCAV